MPLPAVPYPWFALSVKHHHERVVARSLEGRGVASFLPLYLSQHRSGGRTVDVRLPLFPNYVFASFDVRHRLPILLIPGVTSIVSFGRGPAPVEVDELERIDRLAQGGVPLEPYPFLQTGSEVEIVQGSLSGVRGLLVEYKNKFRLIASVPLLQRSVAAEIDRSWVRPASSLPARVAAHSL